MLCEGKICFILIALRFYRVYINIHGWMRMYMEWNCVQNRPVIFFRNMETTPKQAITNKTCKLHDD